LNTEHRKALSPLELEDLALKIKRLYTTTMQARGGSYAHYRPSKNHEHVWRSAADLCVANGLPYDLHVRALLTQVRNPYPYMLLGPVAVHRTQTYVKNLAVDYIFDIHSQAAHLAGLLAIGRDPAEVLLDTGNSLSPLFRYCAAMRAGLSDVANKFFERAKVELATNPGYVKPLNTVFPGVLSGVSQHANSRADEGAGHSSCP